MSPASRDADALPGNDVDARDPSTFARTLAFAARLLDRFFDPRIEGAGQLARDGAALVVGNHSGGTLAMIEPLLLAHALHRELEVERLPHLLLHEVLWHTPLARWIARHGAVRASRPNAEGLFARGRKVLVYPGGDREAYRSFWDRDRIRFGERRGYVQLAIERGVPIVPVVTAGMHSSFLSLSDGHALAERFSLARYFRVAVLPLTVGFPFGLVPFAPPPYLPFVGRVRIRVLPPIQFTRSGPEAAADGAYVESCHRIVVGTMQRALDELASERRAQRRRDFHARLDALVDLIERWTVRAPAERPSLAPTRLRAAPSPHQALPRAA